VAPRERPACRPNFEVLGQGAYERGTITSSVAPEKSGRSVVPVPGLQNAHIPRDWEPATNRYSACWAARDSTLSCARVIDASGRLFPIIVSLKDISETVTVYPTSSLEDDEDDWCHPDEHSSRCQQQDNLRAKSPQCCGDSLPFAAIRRDRSDNDDSPIHA
ncbi:hypothetical protein DPMN_151747, partial [Dreissena polymorpha]